MKTKGRSEVTFPCSGIMRSYPDDPLNVSNKTAFIDPQNSTTDLIECVTHKSEEVKVSHQPLWKVGECHGCV